jgi:hypothetical protein
MPAGRWGNVVNIVPPTPDSAMASLLSYLFGSPSLVVTTFLVINAVWAWWGVARKTISVTAVLFDRSLDQYQRSSLKVTATLRTAVAWSVFYFVASFVTQIWAGSQFSPGQGGGFKELLHWSALFGAITVAGCLYLIPSGDRVYWTYTSGLYGGYILGLIWAVIAFSAKNGPTPGDWWVCPAMSCVGTLGSALRMRIKTFQTLRKNPTI